MFYNWILVLHIMAILSWMACLFYLPRLFIYHIENITKKDFCDIVEVQEQKLYTIIGLPALILMLISGLILLYLNPTLLKGAGFMHTKLLFVFFLIIYFLYCNIFMKQLKQKTFQKTSRFLRFFNEIPTILSLIVIIMIIVRPF